MKTRKSNYKVRLVLLFSSLLLIILATAISAKTTYWIGDGVNLSINPNSDLFVDTINGKVGIGETSPGAKLHVRYPGSTTPTAPSGTWASRIDMNQDSTAYNGLSVATRWGAQASIVFQAASYWSGSGEVYTPILTVTGDQRVGIGDSTPDYKLDVEDSGIAIYGYSSANSGIIGYSAASSGVYYGVQGQSLSSGGIGIYGLSPNEGVRGTTTDTSGGKGVFGYSSATTNLNYGVHGQTDSNAGRGVYGSAGATSGYNYGVYGYTASTDGYAGYFTGGHGVVQGCPSGFTSIMPSAAVNNARQLGCMQNVEQGTGNWFTAIQSCYTNHGGRLPTASEWYVAMNNFGLSSETDDWEWTSSHYGEYLPILVGNGAITARTWQDWAQSWPAYRCWIDI